jgi:hypothetical protein
MRARHLLPCSTRATTRMRPDSVPARLVLNQLKPGLARLVGVVAATAPRLIGIGGAKHNQLVRFDDSLGE